jgi:lipopolysaccharide biosynthesis protein
MPVSAAIYVIQHRTEVAIHVRLALNELLTIAGKVVIVTSSQHKASVAKALADLSAQHPIEIVTSDRDGSVLSAYRVGLSALCAQGPVTGHVMLTGYHVFGPLQPDGWRNLPDNADLFVAYWHRTAIERRLKGRVDLPDRLPYLDFAVLSPALVNDQEFQELWAILPVFNDHWAEVEHGLLPLARFLRQRGWRTAYALPEAALGSEDPRHFEVDKLVQLRAPCLPVSILTLDPLVHDLNAINLRAALDGLRQLHPALYRGVIALATARLPLRAFTTIADQYEILSPHYPSRKKTWSFGPVAVFIHAFYARMMPEFWTQIEKLPLAAKLFVSTASIADKAAVEEFLDEKGWPAADRTVRVVEQNRGRDMSALFITFRDVALSDEFEIGLRLHSKRTPQLSPQVADGFRTHLFDNLLPSRRAVRQLLDRLEAEPDIGLIIPPVIHVGFGTLGHAWFSNRSAVQQLCHRMGFGVPLDADTPVAPYGTMFWFRLAALRPMFEWHWDWADYNPEPHHVDGGLAHVQERMIGYAVQARGFRVLSVMSPELAARNYARLEYKMQLFAGRLASHHVLDQMAELDHRAASAQARLDRGLRVIYGQIIRRFPAMRTVLKPLAMRVSVLLNAQYRR